MAEAYDDKNAEDYLSTTRQIQKALDEMRRDLPKISKGKIGQSELARRACVHKNTIYNRIASGSQWIVDELEDLKKSWTEMREVEEQAEIASRDPLDDLKEMLDLQRKETARMSAKAEYHRLEQQKATEANKLLAKQVKTLEELLENQKTHAIPFKR